jgi:hypothetical protein
MVNLNNKPTKLGKQAGQAFDEIANGKSTLLIPVIVLFASNPPHHPYDFAC